MYNYVVTLQTGSIATAGTFNNYKNRYMLYKGTDEKSYELPGASPSLDYPSPVRALGDNINILPNKATSKKVYEIEWTVNEDGSVHAKGTAIENETLYLVGNDYKQEAFRFKANKRYKNVSNCDILYRKTDGNYGRLIKDTVYSFNEDLICGLVYLIVDAGQTVDETYYPKIVEYYEGIDESYSKYGQGSAEVRQLTNNVIDMSKATARYNTEITEIDEEKGIIKVHRTNTQDPSIRIFCNLPVGQYTMLHNNHNFGQISIYGKNRIVDIGSEKYKTFNATENITDIRIYSGSELDTDYEINFSDIILVRGNVSREKISYVQYQEQAYIIPIQQPMLQGDYFEKETDGWKEVHTFGYVNTKEVEDLDVILTTAPPQADGFWRYMLVLGLNNRKQGSDVKIVSTHFENRGVRWVTTLDGICGWENGYNLCVGTHDKKYDTADKMQTFLQNNDVGIYYKLATPIKLACTEEQSTVLDQLSELELFKGTNNIITAESLALMQMQYIADTQSKIENLENRVAQLEQAVIN